MEYIIGYDIGGTKCAVSLGAIDGEKIDISERFEVPTVHDAKKTLSSMESHTFSLLKRYPVSAIGISCGGPLDDKKGEILTTANLPGWHYFKIVEYVEKKFGVPAFLKNDADACALAEWKFGAGKGTENMIFITAGTGLGAGLILGGRLYSGTNGNAGEVGHIRLSESGPVGFGKAGSLEGFCSGGGISRLAVMMAEDMPETPECIKAMNGNVTTKELARYAHDGDVFAMKVFETSGDKLGRGLSVLIDILNPQKIVLGGVFMRSGDLLIPSMRAALERETIGFSLDVCEIVPAGLRENIGDYAAAIVGSEGLKNCK